MNRFFRLLEKIPLFQKLLRAKLRTKINIYYISILLIALLILVIAISSIDGALIRRQTESSASQTLAAVDKNYGYILQNVYQFSDYLYFDEKVQNALRSTKKTGINPAVQEVINKSLINMIISSKDIASAYLVDNYSNCYSMSKLHTERVDWEHFSSAQWYREVLDANGTPVWVLDDGKSIRMTDGTRPVSLARVICDINTYRPLGVLLINIDVNALQERLGEGSVFLIDKNGTFITHAEGFNEQELPQLQPFSGKVLSMEKTIEGKKCLVVSQPSSNNGWTVVGVLPISELPGQKQENGAVMLLIAFMAVGVLFAGQFYITRLITNPLIRMHRSMGKVQDGIFEPIPLDAVRDDEIVQLKRVFNLMVGQIQVLIHKVTEEQKQLRKSELATLRSQINPHFLYNTLDAVSALALIGDNKGAFELTHALEGFYRVSLSSGQDLVTVKEEIQCIQDYITILNIRYKGIFRVEYDVEPDILPLFILKLILQPFVENAILHGMREKNGGLLHLRGYRKGDMLVFEVEDDGVGMAQEKIHEIFQGAKPTGKGGFGIHSTFIRTSLYYGISEPVCIRSEEGKGTKVTISVPVLPEDTAQPAFPIVLQAEEKGNKQIEKGNL